MRKYPASNRRRTLIFLVLFAALCFLNSGVSAQSAPTDRVSAKTQFDRAEKQRQALEVLPENRRPLKEYLAVVGTYRRVSLITARAPEVAQSFNEIAALYRAMGDLFEEKYYHLAVETYQSLLREYPTSRFREDALLAMGEIEHDDLHDNALAQQSFAQFLALHPRSTHAAQVRSVLSTINGTPVPLKASQAASSSTMPEHAGANIKPVAVEKTLATTDTRDEAFREMPAAYDGQPQVTRVRTWNGDTYTRVVIDVGAQVKYRVARIATPDRIYFDIDDTRISQTLLHKSIEVADNGFLKGVRVAQNQTGVVRVVLELGRVKNYSASLLPDPYRLVVDVFGAAAGSETTAKLSAPSGAAPGLGTRSANASADRALPDPTTTPLAAGANRSETLAELMPPYSALHRDPMGKSSSKGKVETTQSDAAVANHTISPAPAAVETSPLSARLNNPRKPTVTAAPSRLPPTAHQQAEALAPPTIPELTRDGQRSLTRALGLKVGRIVIDAGHGGHDTGTIGPTGLMEKDLCLDVALRVGKMIQERLPGAEVVYTREDDTFIPLEQRTEIANEAKADLFLSVHANSSDDRQARGIETYYLNFTGSSDAMAVASRENSFSENGVHDLQDILKKIARNEKVEESRDFADRIQTSLSKRMDGSDRSGRNRGVRKAPFVVLIGANMPSVLSEISFISNPSDEQWLKKPDSRQKVAEGLYRGIEGYLQSTNSLSVNQTHPAPNNRSGVLARSGNPQ